MYLPKAFNIDNKVEIFDFIEHWSFGDLITTLNDQLLVNHVPFMINKKQNKLYGHFAINNPQLPILEKADDLLIVFKGAHAYISPSWYKSNEMVPTWNFESVHVHGKAHLVTNEKLLFILEKLTAKHEEQFNSPWTIDQLSGARIDAMIKAIAGFEIEITGIEGKSKLSQNRSKEDRKGVIAGLKNQQDSMPCYIARKMESNL